MTDATQTDEDDIALAGEYALHLMDADARLAFERRLAREPALRALVREWDEGLAPLADEIPPQAPPRRVKSAIQARLFGKSTPARRYWFGALGGALAAALLAVAIALSIQTPTPGPSLTAEIAADDRSLVYTARIDTARDRLVVERLSGAPLPGRVHELWLISDSAPAPRSLGVLGDATRVSVEIPEGLGAALQGATLAVSDEPPGGSPTGQPTGAVLATGPVEAG